jgi:pilus assembly protein Flp/PilA
MEMIKNFIQEEDGVTAIEYGLIAALISVVIIAATQLAGAELNKLFTKIKDCLVAANAGSGSGGTCV